MTLLVSLGPRTQQLSACGEGGHTWGTPGSPPAWASPPGLPTPGPHAAGSQAQAGTLPVCGLGQRGTLTPHWPACAQGDQPSVSAAGPPLPSPPTSSAADRNEGPPSVLVRARGAAPSAPQVPPTRQAQPQVTCSLQPLLLPVAEPPAPGTDPRPRFCVPRPVPPTSAPALLGGGGGVGGQPSGGGDLAGPLSGLAGPVGTRCALHSHCGVKRS